MTDPIADMLTRIRNAAASRKASVSLPHSKLKAAIASILKDNGFIDDFTISGEGFKTLSLALSTKPIEQLDRVSKPGRRIYVASRDIPNPMAGRGIVIVSTSSGIMTGRDAKRKGLGGEVLCRVVR